MAKLAAIPAPEMPPLANACTPRTDTPCARARRLRLLYGDRRLCRFRRPPYADAGRYPDHDAHADTFCNTYTHADSDRYPDTYAQPNAYRDANANTSATPTPTLTPTPIPSPTATPAPEGSMYGNWTVSRGEIQLSRMPYTVIIVESTDSRSGLGIRCDDFLKVGISYTERIESESDELNATGSSENGLYDSTWTRNDSWQLIWSADPLSVMRFLSDATEFEIIVQPVGAPSRYSKFDIDGITEALKQVYPC